MSKDNETKQKLIELNKKHGDLIRLQKFGWETLSEGEKQARISTVADIELEIQAILDNGIFPKYPLKDKDGNPTKVWVIEKHNGEWLLLDITPETIGDRYLNEDDTISYALDFDEEGRKEYNEQDLFPTEALAKAACDERNGGK